MWAEKNPLSVLSSVGVRCIIDLTFLSHCWKIENNPSVINKLFNFSDFNNWHWCRFLAHDGLKWTHILKQNKSLNHKVAQIRMVMSVQTEIHNFGTTPPKTWDNWEYRPTAWKLNVTLLLSADSSEKKILSQWWLIGLSWMYCINLLSDKNVVSFSIYCLGGWPWRTHAEERRRIPLESDLLPLHTNSRMQSQATVVA